MLKYNIIATIVASALSIGTISVIPFHSQDFSNIQSYITKSKHEMQLANEVILKLENDLSIYANKIKKFETDNKILRSESETST